MLRVQGPAGVFSVSTNRNRSDGNIPGIKAILPDLIVLVISWGDREYAVRQIPYTIFGTGLQPGGFMSGLRGRSRKAINEIC